MIDSCSCNNFIYYGAEKEKLKQCEKCNHSRYRTDVRKKKVLYRKMYYFPLDPSLQAHYRSYELSHFMIRWIYYSSPSEVLRALADAKTWKTLDEKYDFLRNDPRHVQLGVAMDGFNPFSHNSANHSMWPIVLVNYNLPPWMSIRKEHLILSTIVHDKWMQYCLWLFCILEKKGACLFGSILSF